jgi:hypothetical protein
VSADTQLPLYAKHQVGVVSAALLTDATKACRYGLRFLTLLPATRREASSGVAQIEQMLSIAMGKLCDVPLTRIFGRLSRKARPRVLGL